MKMIDLLSFCLGIIVGSTVVMLAVLIMIWLWYR